MPPECRDVIDLLPSRFYSTSQHVNNSIDIENWYNFTSDSAWVGELRGPDDYDYIEVFRKLYCLKDFYTSSIGSLARFATSTYAFKMPVDFHPQCAPGVQLI